MSKEKIFLLKRIWKSIKNYRLELELLLIKCNARELKELTEGIKWVEDKVEKIIKEETKK